MKIEKLPDYVASDDESYGTSTILVDGEPHTVIDYYDKYAQVSYQILKDGKEVEPERAREIYKAYNKELDDFIQDVINRPPLEIVGDD